MSAQVRRVQGLPEHVPGSRSTGWWGMVLVIASELALFSSILAAYYYTRFSDRVWPLDGIEKPDLLMATALTVVLLSSTLPMVWAERGIKRGDQRALRLGLLIAWILGAIFIGLQAYEYATSTFTWRENAYGSLFFAITALHGVHVIVGLLINAYLQIRARRGHFDADHVGAVEVGALYWHFVDVAWLAIVATVYLSPHVGG